MKLHRNSKLYKLVRKLLLYITAQEHFRTYFLWLSKANLLPKWLWRRLPVDYTFPVTISDGTVFLYCSVPYDTIGRMLYWKGLTSWEAETIPVFYQLAKNARVVLDIGANTGIYSLLACAANTASEVFSFEPVPRIFTYLLNNIAVNDFQDRCHAIEAAVSNSVGQADFCELEGDVPTSSSLNINGFRGSKGQVYKVKTTTIDAVDLTFDAVDLVKIDVEGYEDIVLEGMSVLLTTHRPAIIVECNFDGPFQAVETILKNHGYFFYHITADGLNNTKHILPDQTGKFLNFLCLPEPKSLYLSGILLEMR